VELECLKRWCIACGGWDRSKPTGIEGGYLRSIPPTASLFFQEQGFKLYPSMERFWTADRLTIRIPEEKTVKDGYYVRDGIFPIRENGEWVWETEEE
jgi:hypothetical protein